MVLRNHTLIVRKLQVRWFTAAAAVAKSLQSCPTLCDPIDGSPPGSPVPGILQARTREWVAISFSNTWKWKVKVKSLSCVQLLATPWTAAHQAPLSLGFFRQAYWMWVAISFSRDNLLELTKLFHALRKFSCLAPPWDIILLLIHFVGGEVARGTLYITRASS